VSVKREHTTVSSLWIHFLLFLQNHPHVVERLHEEQRQVVARHGQRISGPILKEMTYADAVIR
jgi:hypothetical protein